MIHLIYEEDGVGITHRECDTVAMAEELLAHVLELQELNRQGMRLIAFIEGTDIPYKVTESKKKVKIDLQYYNSEA